MNKAVAIYNRIGRLRKAIMAEGTPKIQEAWADLEPHVSVFMNAGGRDGVKGEDDQDRGRPSYMGQS